MHFHRVRRATAALLVATAAVPASAGVSAGSSSSGSSGTTGSTGSTAASQPAPTDPRSDAIVITAPAFREVTPERELDQDGIESYGVSTIDELLAEVQAELGDDEEEPLIIVNGHRITDPSEIGALPVEALRSLQVLPRGSAVRAGGKSNQRVISLNLRKSVRSATLTGAEKKATDGQWHSERGEVLFTRIQGNTRANLTLRRRNDSDLLEADRGIIQPVLRLPYALGGNIVGYPNTTGEIDPLLSAAAGQIVTVVPVPKIAYPSISDLVTNANQPAVTDAGQFRTIRPRTRNFDLNGTFSTQLTHWLNATGTIRYDNTSSISLSGQPAVLFVVPTTNPYTVFDEPVGIAVYGSEPLRYQSRNSGGQANLTLDAQFGHWGANLQARHQVSDLVSTSQRTNSSTIFLPDSVNPFAGKLDHLIGIRTDRASTHAVDDLLDLVVNGPLLSLPAGPVQAVAEGRLGWSRLHSESTYTLINPATDFSRNEQSVRGSLDIPLTSRDNHVLGAIGTLGATVEYSRIHFSDAGTLNHHSLALTWYPIPALRLRGMIDQTDAPAPIQTLGDPVIVTPGIRAFDPLTGDTVDVTEISGGNSSLLPQNTKVRNLSAQLRPFPKVDFQLTADYFDTDRRNFLSALPDASAAVMLAFPDRFVRDANGVLTTIDLRPVNFDSDREKRLRWGFNFNRKIGGPKPGAKPAGGPRGPVHPPTLISLNASHTMVFSDEIRIRPGLDPVDLLAGGAIGIGGGRLRHQIDSTASITSGGLGARLGISYRGPSSLVTRVSGVTDTVEFSPLLLMNMRLFADAKRLFPHDHWARGLRLSIDAINITDSRQKVRDSSGMTPLQYQPGYRDPLGRTIEIELRKVF